MKVRVCGAHRFWAHHLLRRRYDQHQLRAETAQQPRQATTRLSLLSVWSVFGCNRESRKRIHTSKSFLCISASRPMLPDYEFLLSLCRKYIASLYEDCNRDHYGTRLKVGEREGEQAPIWPCLPRARMGLYWSGDLPTLSSMYAKPVYVQD